MNGNLDLKRYLDMFFVLGHRHALIEFLRRFSAQGNPLRMRTLVPVYGEMMKHRQRLPKIGCGLRGSVMRMLLQGAGGPMQRVCTKLMFTMARRVTALQTKAISEELFAEAKTFVVRKEWAAAVKQLNQALQLGCSAARPHLIAILVDGKPGVPIDFDEAYSLAVEGEEAGCKECTVHKWGTHLNPSRPDKCAEAVARLTTFTETGHPFALNFLGIYFVFHDPAKREKGIVMLQQAVDMGVPPAMHALAICLMDGIGMRIDEAASIAMFEKAAQEGYPPAMYNLGECFYRKRGTSQQRKLGKQWLCEAVSAGHAGANYVLHEIGKEESGRKYLGRQE